MRFRRARGGEVPQRPPTDAVKVILSPGAVLCPRCDWGAESYSEQDLIKAYLEHIEEHRST